MILFVEWKLKIESNPFTAYKKKPKYKQQQQSKRAEENWKATNEQYAAPYSSGAW